LSEAGADGKTLRPWNHFSSALKAWYDQKCGFMKHDFKYFPGRPAVERNETLPARKRFMTANDTQALFNLDSFQGFCPFGFKNQCGFPWTKQTKNC
jgi:hypothetical protein